MLLESKLKTTKTEQKRNWSKYSPLLLNTHLQLELDQCTAIRNHEGMSVTEFLNVPENVIIKTVDKVAQLTDKKLNVNAQKQVLPQLVKQKINKRKRLLHLDRTFNSTAHLQEIKSLNTEI